MRGIAATLGVAVALAVLPAAAHGYVYWADRDAGTIGRAANDGSAIEPNFISGAKLPSALAVNSTHIFWANEDEETIGRANIDGTGVDHKFISIGNEPAGVAVSGSYVFWTTTFPSAIGRANLDGTSPIANLVAEVELPCGIAVDSGHVYWASFDSPSLIGRTSFGGLGDDLDYVTVPETGIICGLAIDSLHIYWSELGLLSGTRIGRADVSSGEGVDTSFIDGGSAPCGLAVLGSQLYWANVVTNAIGRANVDASGVDQNFIATGGGEVCGLAVDSLAPPPAQAAQQPEQPSSPGGGSRDTTAPQTTIFSGPGKKLAERRAKFAFKSSEAGSRFECRLDGRKFAGCRSPKGYSGLKPGRHTFYVRAIDAVGNSDATPAKRRFRVPVP